MSAACGAVRGKETKRIALRRPVPDGWEWGVQGTDPLPFLGGKVWSVLCDALPWMNGVGGVVVGLVSNRCWPVPDPEQAAAR